MVISRPQLEQELVCTASNELVTSAEIVVLECLGVSLPSLGTWPWLPPEWTRSMASSAWGHVLVCCIHIGSKHTYWIWQFRLQSEKNACHHYYYSVILTFLVMVKQNRSSLLVSLTVHTKKCNEWQGNCFHPVPFSQLCKSNLVLPFSGC